MTVGRRRVHAWIALHAGCLRMLATGRCEREQLFSI